MAMASEFKLPHGGEHTAIWGMTGSGKTQLGLFLLSRKNLRRETHVAIDYKGEKFFDKLERIREIDEKEVPSTPGLYLLRPHPRDPDDVMEEWMWKVWEHENIGLYFDEGYMVPSPEKGSFQALLTQGRSKHTPVITLSQRPVKVSRFVPSEASHVVMFHLNDDRDIDTVRGIVPRDFPYWIPPEFNGELPRFHARWYNVITKQRFVVRPVPKEAEILSAIDGQLEPKIRWV